MKKLVLLSILMITSMTLNAQDTLTFANTKQDNISFTLYKYDGEKWKSLKNYQISAGDVITINVEDRCDQYGYKENSPYGTFIYRIVGCGAWFFDPQNM